MFNDGVSLEEGLLSSSFADDGGGKAMGAQFCTHPRSRLGNPFSHSPIPVGLNSGPGPTGVKKDPCGNSPGAVRIVPPSIQPVMPGERAQSFGHFKSGTNRPVELHWTVEVAGVCPRTQSTMQIPFAWMLWPSAHAGSRAFGAAVPPLGTAQEPQRKV